MEDCMSKLRKNIIIDAKKNGIKYIAKKNKKILCNEIINQSPEEEEILCAKNVLKTLLSRYCNVLTLNELKNRVLDTNAINSVTELDGMKKNDICKLLKNYFIHKQTITICNQKIPDNICIKFFNRTNVSISTFLTRISRQRLIDYARKNNFTINGSKHEILMNIINGNSEKICCECSLNKCIPLNDKITIPNYKETGYVYCFGEGDMGQLGFGEDILELSRPKKVPNLPLCLTVCAGGLHTVCLTENNEVYTFGCNDEGALGRVTISEEENFIPGKVNGFKTEKIIQISAGDSHSLALTSTGKVFFWGIFRDVNGALGTFKSKEILYEPKIIPLNDFIVKISSGTNHSVLLNKDGYIYVFGINDQGQLGFINKYFTDDDDAKRKRDKLKLLEPTRLFVNNEKFNDIWTGQYCTFARSLNYGKIYCWGLNNYHQLGFDDNNNIHYIPEISSTFNFNKWKYISTGQHHTLALDNNGQIYSMGRKEYGRLGLGNIKSDKTKLTLISKLNHIISISAGTSVSFAISLNGILYSWGSGSSQLGQGREYDDKDIIEPKPVPIIGGNVKCVSVSAGGQHVAILGNI